MAVRKMKKKVNTDIARWFQEHILYNHTCFLIGRVMYVIPFSMGPVGSELSKIGVQLTDFNYVILSMRVMTRITPKLWDLIGDGHFVRCVHSIGAPRPLKGIISSKPISTRTNNLLL